MPCKTCDKEPPEVTLKHCAKCSTTDYCSRDCQKADWKAHKKICGKQAGGGGGGGAQPSSGLPPKGLDKPIDKPFTRLEKGTWLHDRSEKDVYRLLLDSFRLNLDDSYNHDGDVDEDSLYGGAPHSGTPFKAYMRRVKAYPGLLPSWWNEEHAKACLEMGMDQASWYSLYTAVEKSDIIEHYGDAQFPMQLRMFQESVMGRGAGGASGGAMRQMMMAMEGGQMGGMRMQHLGL